jgi:predicted DNA-binding protein YlxM (UPF0122 family)
MKPKKRGRQRTTGRFETRYKLVDTVCFVYDCDRSMQQIADNVEVSEQTVRNIINKHYGTYRRGGSWLKLQVDSET